MPVFRCIAVRGQKISYSDTFFPYRYTGLIDRARNFASGSGFQNSDLNYKWLIHLLSSKTRNESRGFWYCDCSKSFPKAITCWHADILNKEVVVVPVAVVIMPPCRLTQSVKTFILYSNLKLVNCYTTCDMFYFFIPSEQWAA